MKLNALSRLSQLTVQFVLVAKRRVCGSAPSAGGEGEAEPDEAEAGDRADGRARGRRAAHAAPGQAEGEEQHDEGHARHQHPGARRRRRRHGNRRRRHALHLDPQI